MNRSNLDGIGARTWSQCSHVLILAKVSEIWAGCVCVFLVISDAPLFLTARDIALWWKIMERKHLAFTALTLHTKYRYHNWHRNKTGNYNIYIYGRRLTTVLKNGRAQSNQKELNYTNDAIIKHQETPSLPREKAKSVYFLSPKTTNYSQHNRPKKTTTHIHFT